jgi:hypothetical protein
MNLAKCADAVLTTADLLSGRPTELLYSFCSFGSFLFADFFPRAIFPLSAMTALLFHLSVLVIWKFAISQPVYYRAYDFSDNVGQCTHTQSSLFPVLASMQLVPECDPQKYISGPFPFGLFVSQLLRSILGFPLCQTSHSNLVADTPL